MVTLVFTDIEGSTRLLHDLGQDGYRDALGEHRRIVRAAFTRHDGYEVDYEGDAFFYAFGSATEAVVAAGEVQAALEGGQISIRVGIHTGKPGLDPPKYVGVDVHLTARVMSAGHGGQVLLTAATRAALDPNNSLLLGDLGEHRLKDMETAMAIYQLGAERFPPLKTISNTNLPRPASSFVGREREVAEVVALVRESRLVTLTGPGGTGKTRLAIEAAAELVPEFKAGVFWVGLSTLRDPALVTGTIAQTLGAKGELAAHIGDRRLLLLLDNFEQVVESAPDLSGLVQACPNLSLLVTSRELLRIQGELTYQVLPLAEPEAVELFCARSRLEPTDVIAELCRRLDSLPLAVELAAARTAVLTPTQILDRLGQRLDLLKGGRDADPRQQTLRATIEWSYDLLSPKEQQLFARLAVFAGGCTLEAAEQIADADLDTLQSLVDKSLLRYTGERFWMLETIHEYALEWLEQADDADTRRKMHAQHFLALAESAAPAIRDSRPSPWLDRLDAESSNLRAAIEWTDAAGRSDVERRFVLAMRHFWYLRGQLDEAKRRIDRALLDVEASPEDRLAFLAAAAVCAVHSGDSLRAASLLVERLALARELGDDVRVVDSLRMLGAVYAELGDGVEARLCLEEGVQRSHLLSGDATARILATCDFGYLLLTEGEYETAIELFEEVIGLSCGPDVACVTLENLAMAELRLGRLPAADARAREALEVAHELGFREASINCLVVLAAVAAHGGGFARAALLLGAAENAREDVGNSLQRLERELFDEACGISRKALGEERYETLFAKGHAMEGDAPVALGLHSIDSAA